MIGQWLGTRYELTRRIGGGAMGNVYEGRDARAGRCVAVKVLHARLVTDALVAERFRREAHAAARLRHRHCVQVLDTGRTDDGLPYLVMPLLSGVELRTKITGALPVPEVVRWIDQVLAGLEHAHARGFVHRDVKPENVLVCHDEHGEHAKLVDFGLVKLLEAPGSVRLTSTGLVFGTPAYMSPEQAAGADVDARADLYAVGVMMHEMLGGAQPFVGPNMAAVLCRHLYADPPALPDAVPEAVRAFVACLLAKDPNDRFASATAARHALATATGYTPADVSINDGASKRRPASMPAPAHPTSRQAMSWSATSSARGERAMSARASATRLDARDSGTLLRSSGAEARMFAIVALVIAVALGILTIALRIGSDDVMRAPRMEGAAMSHVADDTAAATDRAIASRAPEPIAERPDDTMQDSPAAAPQQPDPVPTIPSDPPGATSDAPGAASDALASSDASGAVSSDAPPSGGSSSGAKTVKRARTPDPRKRAMPEDPRPSTAKPDPTFTKLPAPPDAPSDPPKRLVTDKPPRTTAPSSAGSKLPGGRVPAKPIRHLAPRA